MDRGQELIIQRLTQKELKTNWQMEHTYSEGKHKMIWRCMNCCLEIRLIVHEPDVPLCSDVHRAIQKILDYPHTSEQCAAQKKEDIDNRRLLDAKIAKLLKQVDK